MERNTYTATSAFKWGSRSSTLEGTGIVYAMNEGMSYDNHDLVCISFGDCQPLISRLSTTFLPPSISLLLFRYLLVI